MDRASAERRIVTILFADLVGFTALSEGLDAEDVAAVQDAYFAAVRETVGRYGGRLEKFIGDAAMAVFGVPRVLDDDAERAVRAALALTGTVEQLAAGLELEPGALLLRVGVNSGEVVAAPDARADEAVVTGDAVNVAARLQAAAEPGGVLVGETTALAVADAVELEPAGALDLKGKAEPVRAWRAVGLRPERSREQAMGGLRAPLLGRGRELEQLLAAFAGTPADGADRVVVVAPPGVGKTRLVEELAERVDGPVLRARLRPDVVAPYDAVRQLLASGLGERSPEALAELLRASGAGEARAAAVAEEMAAIVAPPPRVGVPAAHELAEGRDARFAAWLEALNALAPGRCLWLVEDAHWAGADVLAFLAAATEASSVGGRSIVATARPSLLESAPDWCAGRVLELPPLPTADTTDLVGALVGDALPAALVESIAERADGNPLFVEELLRTWISVGTLVAVDGGWRLARPAEDVPLPPTVQALYAAQLDDLPAPARAVARRGAVAGRRFPAAALEPLGVGDADAGINALRRRALVSGPHPDALGGDAYAYRHALLRDAGYASLARAERALLHVRLAEWLSAGADRRAGVAEPVARHYADALASAPKLAREVAPGLGRDEAARRAAAWFERAADEALELSAVDAARSLLQRALDLSAADDAVPSARRRRKLGEVTATAADMDEGAGHLEAAIAELEQLAPGSDGARDEYAAAVAALGWVYNEQLGFERAARLADGALAAIGERDDVATARLLLLRAFSIAHGTDEVDRPVADAERALGVARLRGEGGLELDALELLARIRTGEGTAAADEWRAVEQLALERGRWVTAAAALRVQAGLLVDDRAREALPPLARARELAKARGLTEALAWLDYMLTEAGVVSGDWDGAVAAARRAIELGRRNAYHRAVVRTWFALLPVAEARGDDGLLAEAAAWFAALPSRPENPSPYARIVMTAAELRFARAGLLSPFVPDVEERLVSFDGELGLPSWFAGAETVVERWLETGELEGAERCLDRMRTSVSSRHASSLGRGVEALLRARLLAERGERRAAAEAGRALACFRTSSAPWWIAKAIGLRAELDAATAGERAEAAGILRALGVPR